MRDGKKLTKNATELVVGDLIFVKFGDRLPADIRVLESKSFKVCIVYCTLMLGKFQCLNLFTSKFEKHTPKMYK